MSNKSKQAKSANQSEIATSAELDYERSKVLCSIIYDNLEKPELKGIYIADQHLRKIDDLQFIYKSRVDAYLVHWSEWPEVFSLPDLTRARDGELPVLKQLADGWKRLKEQHERHVNVYFLTNDQPSSKKIERTRDCHLAKFLATEWKKNKRDSANWSAFWDEFLEASGLTEAQFDQFVSSCKFKYSYTRPELDEDADEKQPFHCIEQIYDRLFEHEDHPLPVELNEVEISHLLASCRRQKPVSTMSGTLEVSHVKVESFHMEETIEIREANDSTSIRGTKAATWLEAAGDSESEVADWLRKSPENAESKDGAGETASPEGKAPSPFLTGKQNREKRSWKDLAEQNKQSTTGPRKFNEARESKPADADSQRITGKLRQMLSSLPPAEDGDDEDSHITEDTACETDEKGETFENSLPENENGQEPSLEEEPKAEELDLELNPNDTFTNISRLARKQEGVVDADEQASLDAFNWYFNNGNELFESNRFEDAAIEYARALELLNSLAWQNKQEEEFLILQNMGDIYMFLDKPEQAVELYERTKEKRFSAKIPAAKYIAALIKLGTHYEDNNCFSDAENEYRKAVEVAAEFLEEDDPILVRLNEACLNLARNRSTLMSRFSATEVDRIREMAKQEVDVAIIYRKKKTTEAELEQSDIWKTKRKSEDDEEPPAPPSSNQLRMLATAGVFVLFVFAYAFLVPHGGVNNLAGDEDNISYSSADGLKVIELEQGGKAKFTHNGLTKKATYSFVGDTIQDLLPLIPGHLRTSYLFFNSSEKSLVDSAGTHFYTHDAPELQLVKRMWKYAELAQGYRHEKNFYPETNEAWSIAKDKLHFLNPITGKTDEAVVFSTTGEATDTPVRASIAAGDAWKGQPDSAPGRIMCNVYNGRMFFIRAWDRDNKLLTSADKGTCFYIECSDGVEVTKDRLKELALAEAQEQKNDKKLKFVFSTSPHSEINFGAMLSAIPGILFSFVLLTLFVWRYRVKKKTAGPLSFGFFLFSTVLIMSWYVVAILDVRG